MPTIRVLLIADDPLVRSALATLLEETETCRVVGPKEVWSGEKLLIDSCLPDTVLWDLGWQPAPDFELMTEFAALAPPLIALLDDSELVAPTLTAGVRGVLPRRVGGEQLEAGLMAAARNLMVVASEFADSLTTGPTADFDMPVEALTAREMDVLQLMAEGAANKTIARQLSISENTVKYHVNAILGKLDAQSRTEAVVRATRAGLILL